MRILYIVINNERYTQTNTWYMLDQLPSWCKFGWNDFQTTAEIRCPGEHWASLNMTGTFFPSLVWAWRSPCTWLAGGPHQTCPPSWAESGRVGQRGWSAGGSRTEIERAPSWPRPRPDKPWPQHRTGGSCTTGWPDLCPRCPRTDLWGIIQERVSAQIQVSHQAPTKETGSSADVHGVKLPTAKISS